MTELIRHDADPDKVALILPGGGYTPARPLLHFARAVLLRREWTVVELWWDPPAGVRPSAMPPWPDAAEKIGWVAGEAEAALATVDAERVLLVGKSLGTLAAGVAAERGLPAFWLTPILGEPLIAEALGNASAPTHLVGGTGDAAWLPEIAHRHPYTEIADADHGLETDGDPVNSAAILGQVTATLDRFVATLPR
ncbi:hypothetical protein EV193_109100 [Herbihabitans rhizosphaerae]|uniref:Alpha/beta hydrolase family protein n=1 Tax=Herbihabitans rhizosphaerae TaxID=1872711 RepID=A0A4Q7KGD2_9PSEU|nr:alpha/beta hydrolase [Herbihabitans rhizosphaerae]RZS34313.1 hypothetical protein EV193_109100 [Herbihabitans rhizosphaerae]